MDALTLRPCGKTLGFYEVDENEGEELTMSFTCWLPKGHDGEHEWRRDKEPVT